MSGNTYQQPVECGDTSALSIRHRCFLHKACWAAKESPDPSTKNGAVLVERSSRAHVWECNRFAVLGHSADADKSLGQVTLEALLLDDRERKLAWISHAETNAIMTAVRLGVSPVGATLYCPFAACTECAKIIALSGVRELVRLPKSKIPWPETWAKSIIEGDRIMRAAGVTITEYEGPNLNQTYLVNKTEYLV